MSQIVGASGTSLPALSDNGTVITATEPIIGIAGTTAAPSFAFAGETTSGISSGGGVGISFISGGTEVMRHNGTNLFLFNNESGIYLGAGSDTPITRNSAGYISVNSHLVNTVVGVTAQKAETAADTALLTFTPPAVVGSYRLNITIAVSAQNTATLGWTATWKDANAAAQAPTNLSLFTSGTAAPALTVTAATNGNYYGSAVIDTDASATAIVMKLTFAGTSFAAKVTATIERLN